MATIWNGSYWRCLMVLSGAVTWSNCAVAQITPDGTLPSNSIVTTQGKTSIINSGTTAGGNLFHSFDQFSVPTGGQAYFNNAADIQNIISRVTGKSISQIDGLLRANGTANLFLVNPNGIVFGPNARLNIGGSFVGSTASSINFADGTHFSATNPQTAPLLTVSVPIGLGLGNNPAAIRVQGTGNSLSVEQPLFSPIEGAGSSSTGLRVQPGHTLALVGGDVALEGGILTAQQGRIELGSVGYGVVKLSPVPTGWTLGYERVQNFRDIRLLQNALADASGAGGGNIKLVGRQVTLADGSKALIQNQGFLPAGSISVNAAESVEVSGTNPDASLIGSLDSETVGSGSGANIAVSTRQLIIQGGAAIETRSRSSAEAGNITVNADSVQIIGFSPINPTFATSISALTYSSGDAGNITVSTRRLTASQGGQISSGTFGIGKGGDVTVDARDSIEVMGQTSLFSPSGLNAATLNAGNGGNVKVKTSRLVIQDGANVNSSTLGSGDAGRVDINARESIEVSGQLLESPTPTFMGSSAPIPAATLQAAYRLASEPSGDSGDVSISTGKLRVTGGALVDVRNEGVGDAGTLDVNANSILLNNQGRITATTRSGEGGNIFLQAQNLLLRNNSDITATAGGSGGGGNLNINTGTLIALEDSDITADAIEGRGGEIQISTQVSIRSIDSNITASSERGINGVVEINNPDVDPSQGLVVLPAELVEGTDLVAASCSEAVRRGDSKFIITGRGGLPPNPRQVLSSNAVQVDWVELDADAENLASVEQVARRRESSLNKVNANRLTKIVEAQGWIVDAQGKVTLVATAPDATPHSSWETPDGCRATGRQ